MTDKVQAQTATGFGPNNLRITDVADKVRIEFDPRVIIGRFNPSKKAIEEDRPGNPKVCSTGSYRTLDVAGVRVMLHVIGPAGSTPAAE